MSAGSSPLFSDGFETGDLSRWTSATGLVVQTQEVYAGAFAARATSGSAGTFAQEQLAQPASELYVSLHLKPLTLGSRTTIARFLAQDGTTIATAYVTSTGKLGYRNLHTGASVTSATAATIGAWHSVEVRLLVAGSSSEIEFWLDGVRITDLANAETLGTAPIATVELGERQTGLSYDIAYDSIAVGKTYIVSG